MIIEARCRYGRKRSFKTSALEKNLQKQPIKSTKPFSNSISNA